MQSEGFLRVKEAARILGVAPNTIRAWGAAGKIPEYRHPVNNYRLYKKQDLEKILHQLERGRSRIDTQQNQHRGGRGTGKE